MPRILQILLFLLIAFLAVTSAQATSYPQEETVLMEDEEAPVPDSEKQGPITQMQDVCEIVGAIAKMEIVQRSPWVDGTPSTMMIQELHAWVAIEHRAPRQADAPKNSPCRKVGKAEVKTYKICSPAQVKPGDRILATEGTETGSALTIGCLFDIAILPKN